MLKKETSEAITDIKQIHFKYDSAQKKAKEQMTLRTLERLKNEVTLRSNEQLKKMLGIRTGQY